MALSDDIKQLVRREQDIQGVIRVLDTYLTDRQKRRDNYKPIKADKPKVVKITEINEAGDEITRFVPESEAVSRKEGYVTKKAEVEEPTAEELSIEAVEAKYGDVLNRDVVAADVSFFTQRDSAQSRIDRETDPVKKAELESQLKELTSSYFDEYEQTAPLSKDAIQSYLDDPIFAGAEEEDVEGLEWSWRDKSGKEFYGTQEEAIKARDDGIAVTIGKTGTLKAKSSDEEKSQVWKNKLTRSIEGMKENIIAGFGEETYNSYLKLIDDASIVDNQLHDDIMKEINLGVDRKVNVYNTETEQFEIVTQKEVNDDEMGIYVQNKVGDDKRVFMNKQDKDKANRYRSALAISKKNHNTLLKRHGGIDSFLSFSLSGKVSKTNYPDEFEKDMNELYKLQEEMYIAEFLQRNPGLSNDSFEIFSGENALDELTKESYIDAKVSGGATRQNAMDSWNKLDNNKKDKFKNDIKNKLPEMKKLFLEDAKGYLEQYGTLPILNDRILGEVDFMSQILGGAGAPE